MLNKGNYLSTSITRMKKRVLSNQTEAEQFTGNLKQVVGVGIDDFYKRMLKGEVKIETVGDFEKLAKLGLVLHGQPTENIQHTTDVEEVTTTTGVIEEMEGSEEFEALKAQIVARMNLNNENS